MDFLMSFIEAFAEKIVPLTDKVGSKVPIVKDWTSNDYDDSPYRNKSWISKGNNFGIRWKKGIIVFDFDNEEQTSYMDFYLRSINANYYTIKTTRGAHFILGGEDTFFKNTVNYKSFMLFEFDIRNYKGQSVIKLAGDETYRNIIPSNSKVNFKIKSLTHISEIKAFDTKFFAKIKQRNISQISLNGFLTSWEESDNKQEVLSNWKHLGVAIGISLEDFRYAAKILKSYLEKEKKYISLNSYADWDNQIEAYAKEQEIDLEEIPEEEAEGEKVSVRLAREIQTLIDNGEIKKHQDEYNKRSFILVGADLYIQLMEINDLAYALIDKGKFNWMPSYSRFEMIVKVLKGSNYGEGIDFNSPEYHKYILFNNGYLITHEEHRFINGRPDTYCAFKIPINIDLAHKSTIFNQFYSALCKKFNDDNNLTIAFFKNLLDVNGRDGFATFIKGPGNSGKTQFVEFIADSVLTKSLSASINLNQLITRPLPQWISKMLLYANEISDKAGFFETANIKAIITRDSYSSRKLYSDEVTLRSKPSLIFISNIEINTTGLIADNAMERRIFFFEWNEPLFKESETPYWYKKGRILNSTELEEFFSAWVNLFVEQKHITHYQLYIKDTPLNKFKKSMIENNSVYQFLEEIINDIGWEYTLNKKIKYPLNIGVSQSRNTFDISISREFFIYKYAEYCKLNNLGRKSSRNIMQDLKNIPKIYRESPRVLIGARRIHAYLFHVYWDSEEGFKIKI